MNAAASGKARYDRGATDDLIKIGSIVPYSGPASAYAAMGTVQAAFFKMINDSGGINGRRVEFISTDGEYSALTTLERARQLVQRDVLFIFSPVGTPTNLAIRQYLNSIGVPQLFVASGASTWNEPDAFPWTIGFQPSYRTEGHAYAEYLLQHHPGVTIGIFFQDDEYGWEYVHAFKERLAGKMTIVAEVAYKSTDKTIEEKILKLKNSGASALFDVTTPGFAVKVIKALADLHWRPIHILNEVSASIGGVFKATGFDNATDIISSAFLKDANDPAWSNDLGMQEWLSFMEGYYPDGDRTDANTAYGYLVAQALVRVLEKCGNELTRSNIMAEARRIVSMELGMLLPGITVNSGRRCAPVDQLRMARFNGRHWECFGPVMGHND